MAKEIECRYVVNDPIAALVACNYQATSVTQKIQQGYLSVDPDRIVRVRLVDNPLQGFMTIKSRVYKGTRDEFEYSIPASDARALLNLCPYALEKFRSTVLVGGNQWVVDVFLGANTPLVLAECEVQDVALLDTILIPEWAGKNVSNDPRYGNSQLAQHPYSTWGEEL